MVTNLLPAIGFGIACIAAGLAFYYLRRASNLYALLIEGANKYEDLRMRNQSLENDIHKYNQALRQERAKSSQAETQLKEANDVASTLRQKLQTIDEEHRESIDHTRSQRQQIESQLEKTIAQFNALNEEYTNEKSNWNKIKSEYESKINLINQQQAATESSDEESEMDLEQIKKWRRRLAQYDRFYNTMKGLKEIAEERSQNWETALEKMSHWILDKEGIKNNRRPSTIGPLVSTTLKTIGTQIIEDSEALPESGHHDEGPNTIDDALSVLGMMQDNQETIP